LDSSLLDVCVCPRCAGTLARTAQELACVACQHKIPTVQGIPVLSADAPAWLDGWRRQVGVYQALLARGAELMDQQLGAFDLLPQTRQRVAALRTAATENGERVLALLRRAGLAPEPPEGELSEQGFDLIEYYDHLLRDWAWDQESDENPRSRDLVLRALGEDRELGRVLVLGAGGCRLAYDLHGRCKPALTVALDRSPLSLVAAKAVMFGKGLDLYEFPGIPRDARAACVERQLRAPAGAPERFELVLADAFTAPLRPGAFDTVLTPWFIDIVPVDLRDTLSLIHRLLAVGGRWINYGPLNYSKDHPHAQRYTPDELVALARLAGFQVGPVEEADIELLGSRAVANGRTERVLCFAARKLQSVPISPGDPPAWLVFSHLPIPRLPRLDGYVPEHPVLAFIARSIDGVRTQRDLADVLVKQHGARPDAVLAGTRALLSIVYQACR
jgi:uncharacterized protein YbaR (Trm112 family)/SAM-dependent methyltransferase